MKKYLTILTALCLLLTVQLRAFAADSCYVFDRADLLTEAMKNCCYCVIGGEGAIDKDRAMFGSVKKVFE